MATYNDFVKHYQLNRTMHEKFKKECEKKMLVLKHKFVWHFESPKDNLVTEGPFFQDYKFAYKLNLIFIYEDPITHKKEPKVITFLIKFLPPLGQRIEFNGKEYQWSDSLKELFEAFTNYVMSDNTIFGITDQKS